MRQAAERAGVSETLIRGWVGSGRLAHYRLGATGRRGKIAIDPADLDGLIASLRVPAAAPPLPPPPPPGAFKHIRV